MIRSVLSESVSHLFEKQDYKRIQLTPSPIKCDNADINKLITEIGTTVDLFLRDFRDEKLYFISQVR